MSGFTEFDVGDTRKLRNSLDGLSEKVSASIYRLYVGANEFALQGSATQSIIGNVTPVVSFATGTANQRAFANIIIEDYWVSGEVHVDLYYTGGNTSNDYSISVTLSPMKATDDISTAGTVVTDSSVSPPSVANELNKVTIKPFTIESTDSLFALRIRRNVDSNAGDFRLVLTRLRFYASRV